MPGRVLDTGHAQRWPCLPSEEEATDKPSSASHQRPAAPATAAQAPCAADDSECLAQVFPQKSLRKLLFGNVFHIFTCEWTRAYFRFREPYSDLAYALEAGKVKLCGFRGSVAAERTTALTCAASMAGSRHGHPCALPHISPTLPQDPGPFAGGTRTILMAVQAHIIKYLLFVRNTEYTHLERLCGISRQEQGEALAAALADTLWAAGGGGRAVVCLVTAAAHVTPSRDYKTDNFTERIQLFEFSEKAAAQEFIFDHINCFKGEGSHGVILFLYSLIFSRTLARYISFFKHFPLSNVEKQLSKRQMQLAGLRLQIIVHPEHLPAHPGAGKEGQQRGEKPSAYTAKITHCGCTATTSGADPDAAVTLCAWSYRVQEDLDCAATPLLKFSFGNITCTQAVLSLLLTGRASPRQLDGGQEPGPSGAGVEAWRQRVPLARPRGRGARTRTPDATALGTRTALNAGLHPPSAQVCPRLRTPRLPVWLCGISGRHSVLFGTDSLLLSDWKRERVFHLYFYNGQQEQTTTAHLTIGTHRACRRRIWGMDVAYGPCIEPCMCTARWVYLHYNSMVCI
ncbi:inactive ubiquitin carboxyl-terminal hydrolase MINDY-4B [Morphnus guianensis]